MQEADGVKFFQGSSVWLIIQINMPAMEQIAIGNALTQANANGEFTSLRKTYVLDNSILFALVTRVLQRSSSLDANLIRLFDKQNEMLFITGRFYHRFINIERVNVEITVPTILKIEPIVLQIGLQDFQNTSINIYLINCINLIEKFRGSKIFGWYM